MQIPKSESKKFSTLCTFKEKVKAVCYNIQTCICAYIFLRCNLTKLILHLDMMNTGNVKLPFHPQHMIHVVCLPKKNSLPNWRKRTNPRPQPF